MVGRDGRMCVGKRRILENNIYLMCVLESIHENMCTHLMQNILLYYY